VALSTLHHVIDLDWMKEAWRLTRKDGAPGIDGITAADYAEDLEANLRDLLDRISLIYASELRDRLAGVVQVVGIA
jgi:hypothetical protein